MRSRAVRLTEPMSFTPTIYNFIARAKASTTTTTIDEEERIAMYMCIYIFTKRVGAWEEERWEENKNAMYRKRGKKKKKCWNGGRGQGNIQGVKINVGGTWLFAFIGWEITKIYVHIYTYIYIFKHCVCILIVYITRWGPAYPAALDGEYANIYVYIGGWVFCILSIYSVLFCDVVWDCRHFTAATTNLHNDQRLSCLSKLFSVICIIFWRAGRTQPKH